MNSGGVSLFVPRASLTHSSIPRLQPSSSSEKEGNIFWNTNTTKATNETIIMPTDRQRNSRSGQTKSSISTAHRYKTDPSYYHHYETLARTIVKDDELYKELMDLVRASKVKTNMGAAELLNSRLLISMERRVFDKYPDIERDFILRHQQELDEREKHQKRTKDCSEPKTNFASSLISSIQQRLAGMGVVSAANNLSRKNVSAVKIGETPGRAIRNSLSTPYFTGTSNIIPTRESCPYASCHREGANSSKEEPRRNVTSTRTSTGRLSIQDHTVKGHRSSCEDIACISSSLEHKLTGSTTNENTCSETGRRDSLTLSSLFERKSANASRSMQKRRGSITETIGEFFLEPADDAERDNGIERAKHHAAAQEFSSATISNNRDLHSSFHSASSGGFSTTSGTRLQSIVSGAIGVIKTAKRASQNLLNDFADDSTAKDSDTETLNASYTWDQGDKHGFITPSERIVVASNVQWKTDSCCFDAWDDDVEEMESDDEPKFCDKKISGDEN